MDINSNPESPNACLELEYIHGYSCMEIRDNVRYIKQGNIVYCSASVSIALNQGLNTQSHLLEHTKEIACLTMHPNMIYAATGDLATIPMICVWDTVTMKCLARIMGRRIIERKFIYFTLIK